MGGGLSRGNERLIQRSEGICQTIVNDKVIYEDGKLTGEMAGTVLHSISGTAVSYRQWSTKCLARGGSRERPVELH